MCVCVSMSVVASCLDSWCESWIFSGSFNSSEVSQWNIELRLFYQSCHQLVLITSCAGLVLMMSCFWLVLRQKTHRANLWQCEAYGETWRSSGRNFSVCSVTWEAFGVAWMSSALIQLVKSEKVSCWPSEPLESLTGFVLAERQFWLSVC